ncbi:hypothetical protein BB561_005216 [Smittium simulii]|uniref:COG complex component COG2 C-terminal domain-containing protein n=1 Tax=Smittium simulii TaxID=133385 RepID=A0A2T9YBH6_9FUNG|nr:hypothetical protein BB561_005216 [Smittium simulii]
MDTPSKSPEGNFALAETHTDPLSSFISTQASSLSLKDLSFFISEQKATNKKNLDSLIEKKYTQFAGFHTFVNDFDVAINHAIAQTNELKTQIQASSIKNSLFDLKSTVDVQLLEIQETIIYKNQIEKIKKELCNFIKIDKMLQRLDRIVNIQFSSDNSNECQDFIKELVRAASDIAKLKYLIAKDEKYPFIAEASKRLASLIDKIIFRLNNIFDNMIAKWGEVAQANYSKNLSNDSFNDCDKSNSIKDHIIQCLWAYFLLEKTNYAENIFTVKLIRPKIKKLIEKAGLKSGEISINPESFSLMLDLVLNEMIIYLRPIQALINIHLSSTGIDLAVNSFWNEFSSQTQILLPNLFVPGIPSRFNLNYLHAESFIKKLTLDLCISELSVSRLYESETFTKWWKKWHLPAFFVIQQKKIIQKVLTSLTDLQNKNTLLVTRFVFHDTLNEIWSDKLFISSLSPKWWKFTLQLLVRYHMFIESQAKDYDKAIIETLPKKIINLSKLLAKKNYKNELTDLQASVFLFLIMIYDINEIVLNFVKLSQNKILPILINGTQGNTFNSDTETANLDSSKLSHFKNIGFKSKSANQVIALNDCEKKQQHADTNKEISGDEPLYLDGLLIKSVEHISSLLNSDISKLSKLVSSCIFTSSKNAVFNIKQIPSIYRHTNKKMPTQHSKYVDNIFAPLESVLSLITAYPDTCLLLQTELKLLNVIENNFFSKITNFENNFEQKIIGVPCNTVRKIVEEVIGDICNSMLEFSVDLLDNINKANASLERLRGSNLGMNIANAKSKLAANSVNSDDNKIKRQLYFDVLKAEQIMSIGWEINFIKPTEISNGNYDTAAGLSQMQTSSTENTSNVHQPQKYDNTNDNNDEFFKNIDSQFNNQGSYKVILKSIESQTSLLEDLPRVENNSLYNGNSNNNKVCDAKFTKISATPILENYESFQKLKALVLDFKP